MPNLQVKNVPPDLYQRLRRCAANRRTTIRQVVLDAVARELSHAEFAARLRRRPAVELDRPAAAALEEERVDRLETLGEGVVRRGAKD